MKKFNEMSTKDKAVRIGIPAVIVVILLILGIVYFTSKDTQPTDVEVSETEEVDSAVNSDLTLDVDTIEKTEDETIVEPEVVETEVEETEEIVEEIETEVVETEVVEEEPVVEEPEPEVVESTPEVPDTSNVNYALPYIVNGIDIRSGDNDGDGISDNHQNTWFDGQTWTASNGVTIRIADGFKILPGNGNVNSVFVDGTENIEPGSPFMLAFDEYTGRLRATISAADLPDVNTPSSLQTSVNKSDPSFVAYKAAFDPLWQTQNGSTAACLQASGSGSKIYLTSTVGTGGYMWKMEYDSGNGCWVLGIRANYTELIWDSIRNSIRAVCPDGEAVYSAIYELYYYGGDWVADYDNWYSIPNTNSKILVHIEGNVIYYSFK